MRKRKRLLPGLIGAFIALGAGFAYAADLPGASGGGPPKTISSAPAANEDVLVTPSSKRPQSPDGDPRSSAEIQADQMAYDRCLVSVPQSDMHHPVESTPEEYCSRHLGMADRNAIPDSVALPRNEKRPPRF